MKITCYRRRHSQPQTRAGDLQAERTYIRERWKEDEKDKEKKVEMIMKRTEDIAKVLKTRQRRGLCVEV